MPQSPSRQSLIARPPVANDEGAFRAWYAKAAKQFDLDPNPDDPKHFYDYRAAFRAGVWPDASKHWPSEFKREGHPNLIVDGKDTRTGQPVNQTAKPLDYEALAKEFGGVIVAPSSASTTQTAQTKPRVRYPGVYGVGPSVSSEPGAGSSMVAGALKGAAETAVGLGQLAHKIPGVSAATDALYGQPPGFSQRSFPAARELLDTQSSVTSPESQSQSFGKGVERIGEFLLPTAAINRVKVALKTGHGILDAILGAGVEATSAATVQTAQQGSAEGVGVPAFSAGMSSIVNPAIAKGVQTGLSWLGQKVGNALIKANKSDLDDGFHIRNVYKHGLGGSVTQTYDKTRQKIASLTAKLNTELSKTIPGQAVPEVDVVGALNEAAQELMQRQHKTIGDNAAISAAVQRLLDDAGLKALPNGRAGLVMANEIKQGVGTKGAWLHGARDPESAASEIVMNAWYSKLREKIEQAAPAGPTVIGSLNREIGELIPIERAIIRRIPIEQRQNVLSLGDLIGFGTGSWWLAAMNRGLKSGQAANAMVNVSERAMRGLTPLNQTLAGIASQVRK